MSEESGKKIEKLEKKIQELREKKHINSLSDRWTYQEREYDRMLFLEIMDLEDQIEKIKAEG